MTLQELIAQYGVPLAITFFAVIELLKIIISLFKARVQETEVETKKDNTYIDFSVMFNDERRVLQERLDNERRVLQERLDAERKARTEQEDKFRDQFAAINEERAYEKGKLDQIEKTYDREREVRDTKITNLEGRITELEKAKKQDEATIAALKSDNQHKSALLEVERQKNVELQTKYTELDARATYDYNRAETLSKQVEQLREFDANTAKPSDTTQGIPDKVWDEAAEDTVTPLPEATLDATETVVEETKL
jgi:chromosome segregation ATPase